MKISRLTFLVVALCLGGPVFAWADEGNVQDTETIVTGLDARAAVELANRWRWTRKDVTSYVTPKEVVFKFPSGKITRIAMPDDEVLIAVAPYITRTHE